MAKNVTKKTNLWDDLEPEENESTDTGTPTDAPEQESTPTDTPNPKRNRRKKSTPTRTHTPKYAPAHMPTLGNGERKTERLQLLVKPSTKAKLAEYARDHGTSSNEVVQRLLDDLLAGY